MKQLYNFFFKIYPIYLLFFFSLKLKQEEEEREEREKVAPAIGGYHAVTLPLNPTANEHLQKFKDETVNFVELVKTNYLDEKKLYF